MAVVAPIAGASAIVPVIFGIAHGDRPRPRPVRRHRLRARRRRARVAGAPGGAASGGSRPGSGLALIAAVGFGFYFPAMHAAGERRPAVGLAPLPGDGDRPRRASRRGRAAAGPALGGLEARDHPRVGLGDTLGNFLFAASAHAGGLISLTSVLASLYPIVTVAARGGRAARAAQPRWQRLGRSSCTLAPARGDRADSGCDRVGDATGVARGVPVGLDVEADVQHVAVADDVGLALEPLVPAPRRPRRASRPRRAPPSRSPRSG